MIDVFGARPQGQEFLAHDVANLFTEVVNPKGLAIWCGGSHDCMELRGVKSHDAFMQNRHFQGLFTSNSSLKAEFTRIVTSEREKL